MLIRTAPFPARNCPYPSRSAVPVCRNEQRQEPDIFARRPRAQTPPSSPGAQRSLSLPEKSLPPKRLPCQGTRQNPRAPNAAFLARMKLPHRKSPQSTKSLPLADVRRKASPPTPYNVPVQTEPGKVLAEPVGIIAGAFVSARYGKESASRLGKTP